MQLSNIREYLLVTPYWKEKLLRIIDNITFMQNVHYYYAILQTHNNR